MSLSQHDQGEIDKFFADIEPFQPAYRFPSFRYLAIRNKDEWILLHGVVALNQLDPPLPSSFRTLNIRAGEVPLSNIALTTQKFIHNLTNGRIEIGGEEFKFPPEQLGSHRAHHVPFDGSRYESDRAGKLIINGANNYYHVAQAPEISQQLRVSPFALTSISELAARYKMKFDSSSSIHVEIHAPSVCETLDRSSLESDVAHVEIRLAGQLETTKVGLSLRGVTRNGGDANPAASPLEWRREEATGDWRCIVQVPFEDGKSLTCILSYDGKIQNERILAQSVGATDPLFAICRAFDPMNVAFRDVIDDPNMKNRDGLDLEEGVAALLSLAGFRVIAVDHVPGFQGIPDIVAAERNGDILLVECTLKLPNADNKLDKLSRRHQFVRENLDRAGLGHARALALLAVAQPTQKIAPYKLDAQKAGVVLWGREDMHRLRGWLETHTAEDIYDEIAREFEGASLQIEFEAGNSPDGL